MTCTFADARDLGRYDRATFDRLVANGYFVEVRPGVYVLSAGDGQWSSRPPAMAEARVIPH
ncbi:MAG TPA: type IV toxin-antitoxin system AbiEi family antitoxin domain-containing protein [Urbifossiella sp.]|nr:type IV toxin-antitoxin system AbiEi family antitoxin domain-containing protein [Urbifossiella sp.]